MMRLRLFLGFVLVVLSASLAVPGVESEQRRPPGIDQYYVGELAVGDWMVEFGCNQVAVPYEGELTAMSFRPGGQELAYATVTASGDSSLWRMHVPEFSETWILDPQRRLLWAPPRPRKITGPIWWSPDGSKLAVVARAGDESELICVDYLTGETQTLARNAPVADLAWEQTGDQLAYATDSDGAREVWLHPLAGDEPRRLGAGGFNLRFALGGTLSWLRAENETTWVEMVWDPTADTVRQANVVPARTPGTQWSPNGALCAALVPGAGGENQVAIYPARSSTPDLVPLPGASAQRLLGWSPDSRIVLVLAGEDRLLAVSAAPPGRGVIQASISEGRGEDSPQATARATLVGWMFGPSIFDPRVAPTWSAGGEYLAYLLPDRETLKRAWPALLRQLDSWLPAERLLVIEETRRTYVEPPDEVQARATRRLTNIKNVTLALQMYLADNNDYFPSVEDREGLVSVLGEYVRSRDVFTDPETEDEEVVVSFVTPPGLSLARVEDPGATPAVIADYDPDFFFIGYCDGHAASFPRTPEWEQTLNAWREEFKRLRAEEPDAPPPPFLPLP